MCVCVCACLCVCLRVQLCAVLIGCKGVDICFGFVVRQNSSKMLILKDTDFAFVQTLVQDSTSESNINTPVFLASAQTQQGAVRGERYEGSGTRGAVRGER